MKQRLFILLLSLVSLHLHAQQKYWIYLNEKNPALKNAPVSVLSDHLRDHGFVPVIHSAWLNAFSVILPDSLTTSAFRQPCVSHWTLVRGEIAPAGFTEEAGHDEVLKQIHGQALTRAGYTGKGVRIGVIDAGFRNADRNRFLKELIEEGRVKAYRNFIEPEEEDPYIRDSHGTKVLTHIAGYRKDRDVHGLAYDARFYLARTDQDDREYRGEEDYWVAALEWMHAQGVRIVNSSLGYSDGYDDPSENYLPANADGNSSAISRAATVAVKEKGMILVISAGNEGNRAFRVVSLPADAEGVISVGATTLNWPWTKQGYSSVGPAGLPYIKPDVACYAFGGTSYAAPVITGLAAAIWQARPDLSNHEVARWIMESGHLAGFPNNYLGYGVPDARKILRRINNKPPLENNQEVREAAANTLRLPYNGEPMVVYHKSNANEVIEETVMQVNGPTLEVKRSADAVRSTVVYPDRIMEIIWPPD